MVLYKMYIPLPLRGIPHMMINRQNVIAEADGVADKVFVSDGEDVSRGQETANLEIQRIQTP